MCLPLPLPLDHTVSAMGRRVAVPKETRVDPPALPVASRALPLRSPLDIEVHRRDAVSGKAT